MEAFIQIENKFSKFQQKKSFWNLKSNSQPNSILFKPEESEIYFEDLIKHSTEHPNCVFKLYQVAFYTKYFPTLSKKWINIL